MSKRKNFELEYVTSELNELSSSLREELTLYVTGGFVLVYHGLKEGTKDIDVIVRSVGESAVLVNALTTIGYYNIRPAILDKTYRKMQAQSILENRDGFRWDVFVNKVSGKLTLSEQMINRAIEYFHRNSLKLFLLSKEDVFLMKAMTERELDLEDMYLLSRSGLDYDVILGECELQSEIELRAWETGLYERCKELEKRYGIKVPIMRKLRQRAEETLAALVVYEMIRKGARDIETIMKGSEKLTKRDIELGLNILVRKKRIQIDKNGKIKPTDLLGLGEK